MSTDARARILERIRRSVGRAELEGEARAALEKRLSDPRPNLIPARARADHDTLVALFVEKAVAGGASVERLGDVSQLGARLAGFLKQHNLPSRVVAAPALNGLGLEEEPLLELRFGVPQASDQTGIGPAFRGIAETGTLAMISGPDTPSTMNFLPDNHVAILRDADIVGAMEDVFTALRAQYGAGKMPRTLNFISGPSRTADIEQKLVKGAHGPRRLHIMLITDGQKTAETDR